MTEPSNADTIARSPITARITRVADLAATLLFALEGGLVAIAVGLDPVGVLVVCFVSALGGGLVRDILTGALPPAAVSDWHYAVIVIVAAAAVWTLHGVLAGLPGSLVVALDAAGLSMAAIAGTEKSLDRDIHPLVALFLGTVSGVGGGAIRDVIINQVPRVLRVDIYASAACLAALIIVIWRLAGLPARPTAIVAGLACFGLRMAAATFGWALPHAMA
ncbi:trimeric intracellular cation channel family protein [Sphingobium nicotianae]|uniref:TRIC cation channel family protein n=1 Tax=Sphingobium nicotianae TaxID=2782607 RepID=A0A9X1D9R5_9SPHN|nr:TRIC cation channel family protein [Sphingobium nicotianae]